MTKEELSDYIRCMVCGDFYPKYDFHACAGAEPGDFIDDDIVYHVQGRNERDVVIIEKEAYQALNARIAELEAENEQLRIENRELWAAVDSYIEDDQDETAQGGAKHAKS